MKILFIPSLKVFHAKHLPATLNEKPIYERKNQPLSGGYYLPVNFKAGDIDDKLMKMENANCPVCGIKTLSEKQYADIIEESKKINTPEEFYNFLLKNKEHIPIFYSKILKHTAANLENPEIVSMHDLFA